MKIAVLVSGGVDSSVALRLLQQQGHDVTAFYLKIWLEDELMYLGDQCPWQDDLSFVKSVCESAGVPLEVVSLQKEYHEQVVHYTIAEIKAGRTPNPDMLCNQRIKFGLFFNALDANTSVRYDKIATGHYAHVFQKNGRFCLKQAPDTIKDQTYFLSQLSQEQLSRASFPLGLLCKSEVRALAHQFNLINKDRKDSQGICFLGKLKFKDFVKHYLGESLGSIIEMETGKIVGTHAGAWFFTIGQRQGLGLAGGPWYVVAKSMIHNEVYLSRHYYAADKQRNVFSVSACNWISYIPKSGPIKVKMRHGPQVHDALIALYNNNEKADIFLSQDDQGIAAGQFAVFYNDDGVCIGGGVMEIGSRALDSVIKDDIGEDSLIGSSYE